VSGWRSKCAVATIQVAASALAFALDVGAQSPSTSEEVGKPEPAYKKSRQDEDWGFLQDPQKRSDFFDPIKYIPMRDEDGWYLSFGGDIRERYEMEDHPWWGHGPGSTDYGGYDLQRYLAHGDAHLDGHVRFFGEIESSLEYGRNGGPRPIIDEDQLNLHQAFFDLNLNPTNDSAFRLRIGRQELSFGSQRLVSIREEPNVRQSFDGARLTLFSHQWQVDGFATKWVITNPGIFDDAEAPETFWGVYAVRPWTLLPDGTVDVYYLGLDRSDAKFARGTAREIRHSIGTRLSGHGAAWDYNDEAVLQWGSFGPGDIRAWTIASDTGYTLRDLGLRPRLGLKADVTSGDRHPTDPTLGTFNPLFPKGSYFGEIALIAPANHMDLHPSIDLKLGTAWTITPECVFFWRQSLNDGIYRPPEILVEPAGASRSRFVGTQPSIQAQWHINRHYSVTANYTHFFVGPFLRDAKLAENINYVTTFINYTF
jgi:hypothetical protein